MDSKSVFINCPFDNEYFRLLKPLLFTLIYIGLDPQISETSDSGVIRLHKIKHLMSNSLYSIHDLSRMEPLRANELPRFNMPFECGVDFGIKLSNVDGSGNKRFLILEKERYRYQKVISDISGNDIKVHNNNRELIIKAVRDWFKQANNNIPWYKEIWLAYNEFEYDYNSILEEQDLDPNEITEITFSDIIELIKEWITSYKKRT